jgi:hypothetical protein
MALLLLAGLSACKEQGRFEIGYDDTVPPGIPACLRYEPLYGGARIFFNPPTDRDVLSVDATYLNALGETVWFSASYFEPYIEIYGFSDTLIHEIQLYAVDRAGNRSEMLPVAVKPLEPAYTRVARSMYIKAGFASFYVDWKNELEQIINVYVDIDYTQQGQYNERKFIYTSNLEKERLFIRDLELTTQEAIHVKVRVEDSYGNRTEYIDKGSINLLEDEIIPKDKWTMPDKGDKVGGVEMTDLSHFEGRPTYAIDGMIDDGKNLNYSYSSKNTPWNIMLDLGEEWEISRVMTNQRYHGGGSAIRGAYYDGENVGIYRMYIWDDTGERWDSVVTHKIPYQEGFSDMEYKQMGLAGDIAYLYPDEPQFSPPTRRFRFEALFGFRDNYTSLNAPCLSEITLYGRKPQK